MAPAVRTLRGRYPWLVMHGMMRSMLAELHGKLDPDGGVPAGRRRRSPCTEAVFASLRCLPCTVALAEILRAVGANVTRLDLSHAQVRLWQGVPMPAWRPGKVVEPDVIVIAGTGDGCVRGKAVLRPSAAATIPAQPGAVPYHQLAVQYAATKAWACRTAAARLPIIVAVTADRRPPQCKT